MRFGIKTPLELVIGICDHKGFSSVHRTKYSLNDYHILVAEFPNKAYILTISLILRLIIANAMRLLKKLNF